MSVSTMPGASATMRAPSAPCSCLPTREYMSSAALVAQYTPQPAFGLRPAPEEMFSTRRSAARSSTAARKRAVSSMTAVTFRLNAVVMAALSIRASVPATGCTVPALLISR
ncbi:hypothetical protein G6F57_023078 [Rhizopus arrhizus]|nr:hypothetical protein G6F57_023078 [Rhizopus arrhizus]